MLIDERNMKADGLTDVEVQKIVAHIHCADEVGQLDARPALLFSVQPDAEPQLVCVEYAKALESVRPNHWHAILADGHHPYWAAGSRGHRFKQRKRSAMSIDDLFDISQLRRHPPTEKTCWVCAKPWARYDSPRAQQGARDRHGFPKYPVIVLPIKAHLQRIAPEVENVPAQIAVCFECFNQYATIYHHVVADDVDPRLGMNG